MSKQLYPASLRNPDNTAQKQQEYVGKLADMDDKDLAHECGQMIWLSAYANNNPISCYHWQCDATYYECVRRGKEDIYTREHKKLMSQF